MFRKPIMIPAILGLALLYTTSAIQAMPPTVLYQAPAFGNEWHHHFTVLYRPSCNQPWMVYANAHCFEAAEHMAHRLRHQGFEVRIDRCY